MMRWDSLGVHARNVPRPFPYRPRLEVLEGRELPSTVTNLNDAGSGSLRQAILDTPAGGTVDFDPALAGTITLTTGGLGINRDLMISGPGAEVITVSGNLRTTVFSVSQSVTATISGLTIADGSTSGIGGGVLNHGSLTISSSTIRDNYSISNGAGIFNGGTLTITGSTLSGNFTEVRSGAGIFNHGVMTILNSTISNNGHGGAIENQGPLTITSSTVSANQGGIDDSVISALRNTIVAGNSGGDIGGPVMSLGYNLIGDGSHSSGFTDTDLVGTAQNPIDPLLGPLQDNGGPTLTHALLSGSPAIDAGDNTGAPMWDQRGAPFHRIVNGIIDIGAFEVQARGHGGPTHQPLPDPVPVQGQPDSPSVAQPPDLPADCSPATATGARGAEQPGTDPVPTAGEQQAPEALTADAGDCQPGDGIGSLDSIPVELLSMGLSG